MNSEKFDEQALLYDIQLSELALKISKLTFGWKNHSDPEKEATKLLSMVRKISLDISHYEQRLSTKLSDFQRNKIYTSMDELEQLIPYMKNKINISESLEKTLDHNKNGDQLYLIITSTFRITFNVFQNII